MVGLCVVADSYISFLSTPLYPLLSRAASPVRRRLGRAGRAMMDGLCAVADSYFSSLLSPFSFLLSIHSSLSTPLSRSVARTPKARSHCVCKQCRTLSDARWAERLSRRVTTTITNYDDELRLRSGITITTTSYEVRSKSYESNRVNYRRREVFRSSYAAPR